MARIRSIHPGIFTDEAFVSLPMAGRLLLFGLWGEADDIGVFEWKPVTLKMRLFAADDVDVLQLLSALAEAGIVREFYESGKRYGAIRNFGRYQRPKSPKAIHPLPDDLRLFVAAGGSGETNAPLSYPTDVTAAERKRQQRLRERDEAGEGHATAVTGSEGDTPQTGRLPKYSEVSRQMEDGGDKKEKNSLGAAAPSEPAPPDPFEEFWKAYPRREGGDPKKPAKLTFTRLVAKGVDPQTIIAAAKRLARHHPTPTRFCPQAKTWLNEERFADDGAAPPAVVNLDQWQKRLKHARSSGVWFPDDWGPAPGEPGCKVPSALLVDDDGRGWISKPRMAA